MSAYKKRVIYESDEEADEIMPPCLTAHQKRKIICESDDDLGTVIVGSLKRKPSEALENIESNENSNDEWDPEAQRNVMEARSVTDCTILSPRVTRSSSLIVDNDAPPSVRRSQRSASAAARKRLHIMSPSTCSGYNLPGEAVDSLQLLSQQKKTSAQQNNSVIKKRKEKKYMSDDNYSSSGSTTDGSEEEEMAEEVKEDEARSIKKNTRSNNDYSGDNSKTIRESSIVTRTNSNRNQKLSAAKDTQRRSMQEELLRRSSCKSALDALLSEDEEGEGDEENEKDEGNEVNKRNSLRSKESHESPLSQPRSNSKSQYYSQASKRNAPSRRQSGSAVFFRKETLPEQVGDSDEEEGGADDFIVGSDEERDELNREMENRAREKEKRRRRKEKEKRQRALDEAAELKRLQKKKEQEERVELARVRELHSQTKSSRRRVIAADEDDDENGNGNDQRGPQVEEEGVEEVEVIGHLNATRSPKIDGSVSYSDSRNAPSATDAVQPIQASSSSSNGSRGRRVSQRIVIESSEDEMEVDTKVRNKTVMTGGAADPDSEGDANDGDGQIDDSASEEDEDEEGEVDSDDEAPLDGPMLYRMVDAMREEEEEEEEEEEGGVQVTPFIRQVSSHPEALMLYVEMLAHAHVDPSFVSLCADISLRRPGAKTSLSHSQGGGGSKPVRAARVKQYIAAARQIENLICTSRESLLGSSAWRPEFLKALKSRPFYFVTGLPTHCRQERCEACNRTSQDVNRKVHLFGPHYDADRAWIKAEWARELPAALFLDADHEERRRVRESNQQRGSSFSSSSSSSFSSSKAAIELSDSDNEQEEEEEGRGRGGGNVSHSNVRGEGARAHRTEDEEDDDDEKQQRVDVPWWQRKWRARLVSEKESGWHLASHCRARTQMYHTLLHYKARLFLKVGDKLRSCGSVDELIADAAYMNQEVQRFQALLKQAGDKWGGGREMSDEASDLWLDYSNVSSARDRDSSRAHSSQSGLHGSSKTSVLDWVRSRQKPSAVS